MRASLLCKNAIVDGGDEDDRWSLARSESACSFSSPDLGGGSPVSAGVRMKVKAWVDEHGRADSRGGADLATVVSSVSSPCHSPPCCIEPLVTGPLDVGVVVDDADVLGSSAGVAVVSGGEVPKALQIGDSVQAVAASSMIVGSLPPLCGGIVGMSVDGLVREEARVAPVVREALRSQPTDGLRQPPSSPVVPASGPEGGVGMDGIYGCQSFAHTPPSVCCPPATTVCGAEPLPRHLLCDRPRRLHRDWWPSSRIGWLSVVEMKLSASDFDNAGCEILDLMRRGVVGLWLLDLGFTRGSYESLLRLGSAWPRLASVGCEIHDGVDANPPVFSPAAPLECRFLCLQCDRWPSSSPHLWVDVFDAMNLLTVEDEEVEGVGFHVLDLVFCLGSCQGFVRLVVGSQIGLLLSLLSVVCLPSSNIQVAAAVGGLLPSYLRVVRMMR
ncbi:hypothetical protein Dimus_022470 [Dionaea muscipula]